MSDTRPMVLWLWSRAKLQATVVKCIVKMLLYILKKKIYINFIWSGQINLIKPRVIYSMGVMLICQSYVVYNKKELNNSILKYHSISWNSNTLPHLSVRVLNCLLRGSRRSIPKVLMVRLPRPPPPPPRNSTPDFKFCLGKLTNKMFPM